MLRNHVLAALHTGITANDEDAAREALRGIDPLARGFARRKLNASLIDAALACDAVQITAPSSLHVMQLAALAQRKQTVDVADPAAVAAAYAALPKTAMPRFPLWTVLTTLLVTAAAAGLALAIVLRPGPAPRTYAKKMPPPSAAAFKTGGVPLRDAAIDKLLVDRVTDLVVHGGRARDLGANDLEKELKKLRTPKAIVAKGAPLAKAWDAMLDMFAQSVQVARQPGGPTQRQRDELREAVREVSDGFIAAGLGYLLEGRFKAGYPYIQAYRVEEVVFVTTNGSPRRVLSLRRLDKLNTAYAALGMHDEDVGDPTLHLERIDENVASTVLPLLAPAVPYPVAEKDWLITEEGKALSVLVGETVRREYIAALGPDDAKTIEQIATLLAKRGDIVDEWRDHLDKKKIRFVRTDGLFLPPTLLDDLEEVTPKYQRNRVREIENQLAALEAPRIHTRVHDMVAATVRRHEAQHGFDYDRDTELRHPEALAEFVGSPHDAAGEERPLVRSARAELAAYLSQIANDPLTPHAAFWHLGRTAFTRDRWGTGESYAAVVIIEGLAKQLGATIECCTFRRGIDRERLAKLATVVAQAHGDKLRAAASALWSELYGEPLTKIVDAPPRGTLASR